MEAFGLAVIVILVAVGLLLYLTLRSKTPKNEPIKAYIPSELSNNFVNSIISTNVVGCIDVEETVGKLLAYCSSGYNITSRCSGQEACTLVNRTISDILQKSLGQRNDAYVFFTKNLGWPNGGDIILSSRGCAYDNKHEGVLGETVTVQEQTYKTIMIDIYICK